MTRSTTDAPAIAEGPPGDEVRWRGLRTTQLIGAPGPAARAVMTRPTVTDPVPRARYVALFASESHQITPELRLPRKNRNARPQGLLTWAVVEALSRKPATWRDLFDGVLAVYPPVIDELAQRFPTRELPSPVAEGNLDAPIFANRAQAVSTRPVWRAQRSGDTLTLQAGQLDGLVAQQPLRVLATMDDGTVRSAEGTLAQAFTDKARMAVPPALRELPGAALWNITPLGEPAAVALRVRAEQGLPPGLSLEYPASVIAVNDADGADVRWSGRGSKCCRHRSARARSRRPPMRPRRAVASKRWPASSGSTSSTPSPRTRSSTASMRCSKSGAATASCAAAPRSRSTRSCCRCAAASAPCSTCATPARARWTWSSSASIRRAARARSTPRTRARPTASSAARARRPPSSASSCPGSTPRAAACWCWPRPRRPTARRACSARARAMPCAGIAEVRVRGALQPESERQTFAAMVHWAGEVSAAK
jgi:hypothetical protein